MSLIEVQRVGALVTVQDRGRPGYAHLGVGRSGAADRTAHDAANRLVGNDPSAATLEVTLGGLRIRAADTATLAVTGARVPLSLKGIAFPAYSTLHLRAGDVLTLGVPADGLRSYLAVRGGIDVPPVLGSRATDTLAGLGPEPVRAGDRLPIGRARSAWPATELAPPPPEHTGPVVLRIRIGPRHTMFDADALRVLTGEPWTVTPDANRVGARLTGPRPLVRSDTRELPSEGMVPGSLQVPSSGFPVLFLADHPVTGGYPVIAVVTDVDLPAAAQLRPGDVVRFSAAQRR
ncbi:biotin-dependent carboxyltransferase family protein [Rhodococcus gannanensis]|uniref:Biotin-dependent carboxyltransferase family protein n=1 Tax=Rhodococcus gannanensis TaxID=1960308 RepID=A0ABW4PBX9_9NOCA